MASLRSAKDEDPSFFTQLRRLGREVDQGVKDVQGQLETRGKHPDTHTHLALKGLLDRRQEVQALTTEARQSLKQMRQDGRAFEQNLQACSDLMDLQLKELTCVQTYLMQYGFVPMTESEDDTEKTAEDNGQEKAVTPPASVDQKEEGKKKRSLLSPVLEDFGLSSFTLNMLNRPAQHQHNRQPPREVPSYLDSRLGLERRDPSAVPTPFQNRGLRVTPSMFPGKPCCFSPDESFSLPCTPQCGPPEVEPRTLQFVDSPVPPTLHTPGVRQIPRVQEAVRQIQHRESQLRQHLAPDHSTDSPVPPVLRTPGFRQILARQAEAAQKAAEGERGGRSQLAEQDLQAPKTPEMTFSLKDLEDMTISFRQDPSTNLSDRLPATSEFDASVAQPNTSVTSRQGHAIPPYLHGFGSKHSESGLIEPKGPKLQPYLPGFGSKHSESALKKPQGPKLHPYPPNFNSKHSESALKQPQGPKLQPYPPNFSSKLSESALKEPQLSEWSRERWTNQSVEVPPSPELTLSYTSIPHKDLFSGKHNSSAAFSAAQHLSLNNRNISSGRGKENLVTPTMPELTTSKLQGGVLDSAVPAQPRMRAPLKDSNLDLPPTPKLMGSYSFTNSKR